MVTCSLTFENRPTSKNEPPRPKLILLRYISEQRQFHKFSVTQADRWRYWRRPSLLRIRSGRLCALYSLLGIFRTHWLFTSCSLCWWCATYCFVMWRWRRAVLVVNARQSVSARYSFLRKNVLHPCDFVVSFLYDLCKTENFIFQVFEALRLSL